MLDNANPTVLNVSELPARRERRQRKDQPEKGSILDRLYGKQSWERNPYYTLAYSDADLDDTSENEPIDEQEIYGELIKSQTSFILLSKQLQSSVSEFLRLHRSC